MFCCAKSLSFAESWSVSFFFFF